MQACLTGFIQSAPHFWKKNIIAKQAETFTVKNIIAKQVEMFTVKSDNNTARALTLLATVGALNPR